VPCFAGCRHHGVGPLQHSGEGVLRAALHSQDAAHDFLSVGVPILVFRPTPHAKAALPTGLCPC
jgi:hypothetical protein